VTLKNIFDDYLNSVSYFFHGLAGYLLLSLDTILIGLYLGVAEVGMYQSIMKLVGGILLITEAMNNVSLTKFTGLYNARDFSGFKKLKRQVLILSLSFGLMLAVIAIFTVTIVFPKFLDESYNVSVSTLTLLILVIPVRFYTVYYAVTLTVFDLQMKRVKFSLYALCIMFITISLFVPVWSVEGAAGAMLFTSLSLLYFYRKECVINEKRLFI
jgi:O-antigen/teichoic acid export membrane protein